MIELRCPSYPEKGQTTILTTLGVDWEVEVRNEHGFGIVTREPGFDRTVDLEGALDVLWDADNGGADEFVRALGLPDEISVAAWKRHCQERAR